MRRVTILVSPFLTSLAQSPVYWLASALTGVAATFCPLFIYQFARQGAELYDLRVLLNFAIILFVVFYHSRFAQLVVQQIRSSADPADESQ